MLTLKELDEAIELNANANASGSLGSCFNGELMAWILTEIKSMLFKADGTRRNSILVGKGRLIMFAITLAGKIAKCLFDNRKRKEQPIQP